MSRFEEDVSGITRDLLAGDLAGLASSGRESGLTEGKSPAQTLRALIPAYERAKRDAGEEREMELFGDVLFARASHARSSRDAHLQDPLQKMVRLCMCVKGGMRESGRCGGWTVIN